MRIAPAAGGNVIESRGTIALAAGRQESEPAVVDLVIPEMRPWSPEDPFLYSVEVRLGGRAGVLDSVRDRFGMRQFEVGPGGVLLLNGRPYFVRGLGDDTFEVLTGTQHPDKAIYRNRLAQIKRYGFNGVRFLSHTPIKEYFEAADEVGVLVMCEGEIYQKPKEVIPLLKKQVARIAKAYRNHPSWYLWSSGNEFFECQGGGPDPDWMDYILHAHATFKRLDPTRFFIASDGADVFPADIITQRAKFDADGGPAPEHPFDGLIDEVAYFKRALSDAEMLKAGDVTAPAAYAPMILSLGPSGYWRLGRDRARQGPRLQRPATPWRLRCHHEARRFQPARRAGASGGGRRDPHQRDRQGGELFATWPPPRLPQGISRSASRCGSSRADSAATTGATASPAARPTRAAPCSWPKTDRKARARSSWAATGRTSSRPTRRWRQAAGTTSESATTARC